MFSPDSLCVLVPTFTADIIILYFSRVVLSAFAASLPCLG